MLNTRQSISGCSRSGWDAAAIDRLKGALSILRKRGMKLLAAPEELFAGAPVHACPRLMLHSSLVSTRVILLTGSDSADVYWHGAGSDGAPRLRWALAYDRGSRLAGLLVRERVWLIKSRSRNGSRSS